MHMYQDCTQFKAPTACAGTSQCGIYGSVTRCKWCINHALLEKKDVWYYLGSRGIEVCGVN